MSTGRVLCGKCKEALYSFDDLVILDTEKDVVVRPKVALNYNHRVRRRNNPDDGSGYTPKMVFCSACDAQVGKCHIEGVCQTLTERPSAKRVYIKVDGGELIQPTKWESHLDLLTVNGVDTVSLRDLIQSKWPVRSRVDDKQYDTCLIDVENTPVSTLLDLTSSNMRDYQLEMTKHSLQRNSLVCLPTGSGKTLISAGVIAAMLHVNPDKIAVFVVKTNQLAEQQSRYLEAELPDMRIITLSGQMDYDTKLASIKSIDAFEYDILVCTCDTLNQYVRCYAVRIEDMCCLILDEAHHAKKKDPYAILMRKVYECGIPEQVQPLVLGLTASPIDEKPDSNDIKEALRSKISELSVTLGCMPTYPLEHDPYDDGISQTRDFTSLKIVQKEEAKFSRSLDDYLVSVIDATQELIGRVCPLFLELQNFIDRSNSTLDTNNFRGKLRDVEKELDKTRDVKRHDDDQHCIQCGYAVRDHLNQILAVHEINKVIGHEVAMERMRIIFEEIEDPCPGQQAKKKKVLYEGRQDGKALYTKFHNELRSQRKGPSFAQYNLSEVCKKILSLIEQHRKKHNERTRILIFVDMRRTAKKLCACLQQLTSVRMYFNPQVIVGRGLQGDGLTIEEQKDVLTDFRNGSTRLLVTTTILEEGLDVPDCNMVIRLRAPGNLREFIQSRGRACRSNDGEFHVFCDNETEKAIQQSFINCVMDQPTVVKEYMKGALDKGLLNKEGHERKILDLEEDSGRKKALQKVTAVSKVPDEEMEELVKLITETEMAPQQEEDLRFLDEYEPGEVSLSLRFAWWPCNQDSYESEVETFKEILKASAEVVIEDWRDQTLDAEHLLLGTCHYPEVKLISPDAKGVEEMSIFEKAIIGQLFMKPFLFDNPDHDFWVSIKNPHVYFPRSTALRLSLAKVNIGSLVSPNKFIYRLTMDQASKVVFDRSTDTIAITINDNFKIEASFSDLQNFVVVDEEDNDEYDQDPIVRLCFTFLQPPRLSIKCEGEMNDSSRNFDRVSFYNNKKNRRIFAKCLTYQIEAPNNRSSTKNCNFDYAIQQILRLLESCGKTIYYTHVKVVPAFTDLPPEDQGIDSALSGHHASKDVNYAMKCLESSRGFMFDRLRPDFFGELAHFPEEAAAKALYKLTGILNKTVFCDYTLELRNIHRRAGIRFFQDYTAELKNHKFMKRVIITPTQLLFFEPDFIQTNRTVRDNGAENFLRVAIRDETCENLTSLYGELTQVVNRVRDILTEGIKIGDTEYSYLASSSSQLRGHSCYFIEDNTKTVAHAIREDQGDLSEISIVGKYLARMGLGFSTSDQTIPVKDYITEVDVEFNDYTFSDGVGLISESLARRVAAKLKIDVVPSAFQIRLGGCKGVLTVWSDEYFRARKCTKQLVVRKSMYKFPSQHKTLEVLEKSRPLPLHLNHQVIMLLNNVGVPDHTFLDLLRKDIGELARMFVEEVSAKDALKSVVSDQVKILEKVKFRFTTDIYFRQLMMAIYKVKMKDLRERSRVRLDTDKARILIGVLDETGILQYGQVFIQVSKYLEQPGVEPQVITSKVAIMKNPCIHPGDIRVLQGRNVPELRHLMDCVVFPQNGPRPHPNELSGSDLDGDQYHCIWEPQLLPTLPLKDPMDYSSTSKATEIENIGVDDMIRYTCKYIKNDNLGVIDNLHKALADQLTIESEPCLQLAEIHAKAVDAPKTEDWQEVPKEIRELLKRYPDFMMKHDKPSYPSTNVLGTMFRECNKFISDCLIPLEDGIKGVISADSAFQVQGYEAFSEDAKKYYKQYGDELTTIMKMYGIQTESELITGYIVNVHARLASELDDIIKNAKILMKRIFLKYRRYFFENEPRFQGLNEVDRRAKELEKASAWYWNAYQPASSEENGQEVPRFLSFAWIVSDLLADIYLHNTTKMNKPLKSPELAISNSISNIYFDLVEAVSECYQHHQILAGELNKLCYRFGQCFLTGLSSTLLFDQQYGQVSVLILKKRQNPGAQKSHKEANVRLLERLGSEGSHALADKKLDDASLHLRLRHKSFNLVKKRANVTSDDWSLYIWTVIKSFIFKNPWLHPLLRLLCSWVRNIGLVDGKTEFLPDYLIPIMFINYCLQRSDLKDIDFSNAYQQYSDFIGKTSSQYPLGSLQEWKELMKRLKEGNGSENGCSWEGNHGKAGSLLSTFFSDSKTFLNTPIHEKLEHVLSCNEWKVAAEKSKINLLEAEMEKASHRLLLHMNAGALLSKVNVERVFFLELAAAREFAGNEDALAKTLYMKCGARVDIQTKMSDSKQPGMIVKANGTEAELYLLDNRIRYLNKKSESSAKFSRKVRVKGMRDLPGAHNLLIDGSTPDNHFIRLEPYFGVKYPQHDYRNLYVPRLFGSSASARSSESIDSPVAESFRTHIVRQLSNFNRKYSKDVYGECEFQIKFGRCYIVSPPTSFVEDPTGLTAEDLMRALENKRTREVDPTWDPMQSRSRSNYNTRLNGEGRISSSFVSSIQKSDEMVDFVREMQDSEHKDPIQIESGIKMVVEQATGSVTARYNTNLDYVGLETSPFRWIISDVKRHFTMVDGRPDGDECDIRFMLKSQTEETQDLDEHALSWNLKDALMRDEKGKLCVKNEELDVQLLEEYDVALYKMKPTGTGIHYNAMFRKGKQYTRRIFVGGERTTFANTHELWELRIIPQLEPLLSAESQNDALDSVWQLAFQYSSAMKARTMFT